MASGDLIVKVADNCGADYLNLNNSAGNANWNIGASNFFSYRSV